MAIGRNILLFHLGALGDFVVTWPLALTLARIYPQSRLFCVTHAQKGALAEKVLRVESLDIEGGWHHLYTDPAALPEASAKRLAGAHSVVSFIAAAGDPWTKNVQALAPAGAAVINLTTKPPEGFGGHVSEFLLEQLSAWSAAQTAAGQILRSIASRGIMGDPTPGDTVVIHPGAGSPRKCWPAEKFLELIGRLREEGRPVRVLIGEVEREAWGAGPIDRLRAVAEVVEPGTLVELMGHLHGARAFVGNDSGPGHLAGILGVPTLSVFGPASNAANWRPLGPRVRVVEAADLQTLAAGRVYDELSLLLGAP